MQCECLSASFDICGTRLVRAVRHCFCACKHAASLCQFASDTLASSVIPLFLQVQNYVEASDGKLSNQTLYLLFIGANDYINTPAGQANALSRRLWKLRQKLCTRLVQGRKFCGMKDHCFSVAGGSFHAHSQQMYQCTMSWQERMAFDGLCMTTC